MYENLLLKYLTKEKESTTKKKKRLLITMQAEHLTK